jgi:hypothetical protein
MININIINFNIIELFIKIYKIINKMYNKVIKRTFWSISKGNMTGYIEGLHNTGFIFKHDEIFFRKTSSNLANGEEYIMSLEKMNSRTTVITNNIYEINQLIRSKKPVVINYEQNIIGLPTKGNIFDPIYISSINKIDDEDINIKMK